MGDHEERQEDPQEEKSPPASTSGITATIPLSIVNANSRMNTGNIQFRIRGSTITGSSPPQFISFAEIMSAAHGIQNMTLAHEIAIDNDFRLEPFEPPDDSYQKIVKDTMHRAFFDILREELNSDPPKFKQAFVLLEDVKEGLFSILLPRHTKIREMIEEVLDQSFIRHQAENGAIEFKKYSDFVIDLMAKLAAPCRDDMIQNITHMEDTVETFRAILEALEVLKLDLANTLITMIRPYVQAQSVQYEQQKFKEFLEVQEDGLENTRMWLIPHIDKNIPKPEKSDPLFLRNTVSQTLAKAYLGLLEWDKEKTYPESVQMDAVRFADMAKSVYQLVVSICILLVSPTCSALTQASTQDFKMELKNKIIIIIQDTLNDSDLEKILPALIDQVISDTNNLLLKFEQQPLTDEVKDVIKNQIETLKDPENKIRQLVRKRVLEFLKEILICGGGSKQIPIGMSAFHSELTTISGTLLRLVMHNKAVFSQYYTEIVAAELDKN